MTTYVCPDKDIVCGDRPQNWCSACPKRSTMSDLTDRHPAPAEWCRSLVSQFTAFGADRKEVKQCLQQAADEIDRLTARVAVLEQALQAMLYADDHDAAIILARAALKGER